MSKVQKPSKKQFFNRRGPKRTSIDVNLKGFLCSCNNREKDCIRESYNLLNKYADILWASKSPDSTTVQGDKNDIEDDLQKELKELRSEKKGDKRFQVVDSGAKNFLFIKTTVDDPLKLAESILQEIFEKKTQETKFLLRLIPIETTCKAYVEEIENAFEPLCEKHFSTESKTFSIVFNHRNNNSLQRDEIIKTIAENIANHGESKKLAHKVDLKNAEVSVVIEIIRGFAFLGVVPNFFKYKKYNLLAFVNDQETETKTNLGESHLDDPVTETPYVVENKNNDSN